MGIIIPCPQKQLISLFPLDSPTNTGMYWLLFRWTGLNPKYWQMSALVTYFFRTCLHRAAGDKVKKSILGYLTASSTFSMAEFHQTLGSVAKPFLLPRPVLFLKQNRLKGAFQASPTFILHTGTGPLIDPLPGLKYLPTEAGSRKNSGHTPAPWVIDFVKQPYTSHCLIADMHSVSAGTKSLSYHVCSWASPPENELPPGFAPQCPFSPSQSPAGWWGQIVSAASRSPHCWSQCLTQGGKIDLHDETGVFFPLVRTTQLVVSMQKHFFVELHCNYYLPQTVSSLQFWRWQIWSICHRTLIQLPLFSGYEKLC